MPIRSSLEELRELHKRTGPDGVVSRLRRSSVTECEALIEPWASMREALDELICRRELEAHPPTSDLIPLERLGALVGELEKAAPVAEGAYLLGVGPVAVDQCRAAIRELVALRSVHSGAVGPWVSPGDLKALKIGLESDLADAGRIGNVRTRAMVDALAELIRRREEDACPSPERDALIERVRVLGPVPELAGAEEHESVSVRACHLRAAVYLLGELGKLRALSASDADERRRAGHVGRPLTRQLRGMLSGLGELPEDGGNPSGEMASMPSGLVDAAIGALERENERRRLEAHEKARGTTGLAAGARSTFRALLTAFGYVRSDFGADLPGVPVLVEELEAASRLLEKLRDDVPVLEEKLEAASRLLETLRDAQPAPASEAVKVDAVELPDGMLRLEAVGAMMAGAWALKRLAAEELESGYDVLGLDSKEGAARLDAIARCLAAGPAAPVPAEDASESPMSSPPDEGRPEGEGKPLALQRLEWLRLVLVGGAIPKAWGPIRWELVDALVELAGIRRVSRAEPAGAGLESLYGWVCGRLLPGINYTRASRYVMEELRWCLGELRRRRAGAGIRGGSRTVADDPAPAPEAPAGPGDRPSSQYLAWYVRGFRRPERSYTVPDRGVLLDVFEEVLEHRREALSRSRAVPVVLDDGAHVAEVASPAPRPVDSEVWAVRRVLEKELGVAPEGRCRLATVVLESMLGIVNDLAARRAADRSIGEEAGLLKLEKRLRELVTGSVSADLRPEERKAAGRRRSEVFEDVRAVIRELAELRSDNSVGATGPEVPAGDLRRLLGVLRAGLRRLAAEDVAPGVAVTAFDRIESALLIDAIRELLALRRSAEESA